MTNIKLLKSKMILSGYTTFTTDLMNLLDISWTSASSKMNGKVDFTQKEISILTEKLNLNNDDLRLIFVDGVVK